MKTKEEKTVWIIEPNARKLSDSEISKLNVALKNEAQKMRSLVWYHKNKEVIKERRIKRRGLCNE